MLLSLEKLALLQPILSCIIGELGQNGSSSGKLLPFDWNFISLKFLLFSCEGNTVVMWQYFISDRSLICGSCFWWCKVHCQYLCKSNYEEKYSNVCHWLMRTLWGHEDTVCLWPRWLQSVHCVPMWLSVQVLDNPHLIVSLQIVCVNVFANLLPLWAHFACKKNALLICWHNKSNLCCFLRLFLNPWVFLYNIKYSWLNEQQSKLVQKKKNILSHYL